MLAMLPLGLPAPAVAQDAQDPREVFGRRFEKRREVERGEIAFTFVSDEFNGVALDNEGNVRPLLPRSFETLSQAEEENGQSRIYLGIHWAFDKTEGIAQGRAVADYVFENAFEPRKRGR